MKVFIKRGNIDSTVQLIGTVLRNLNLEDNFQGFSWTGTIEASSEVSIPNKMPGGHVPTGFLVTMVEGTNLVTKGETDWSSDRLSLKNDHATVDSIITVFFYR